MRSKESVTSINKNKDLDQFVKRKTIARGNILITIHY